MRRRRDYLLAPAILPDVMRRRCDATLLERGFVECNHGGLAKTTLHYIQELKKKHAIDYDSHASYRFVEVADGSRSGEPAGADSAPG